MNNLNVSSELFCQQFPTEKVFFTQSEVWDGEKTVIQTDVVAAYKASDEIFVVRSQWHGNNGFSLDETNRRISDDESVVSATILLS